MNEILQAAVAGVVVVLILALVVSLLVLALAWIWRLMPWSARLRARNEAALRHAGYLK